MNCGRPTSRCQHFALNTTILAGRQRLLPLIHIVRYR